MQDYVKYIVWCVEYGSTNYHHMHIHIEHKIKLHRKNRYYDEVLGAHPYIQRVGTSPLDKRRIWRYYMKEGDWHCLHRNNDKKQKLKNYIEKEVSLGEEITRETKTRVERQLKLDESVKAAVARFLTDYEGDAPAPEQ